MSEVVLFGATGYTGGLTARAMVRRGLTPVLAGRNVAALGAVARDLGGLTVRRADAADPASVRGAVKAGDVLVSTVGPFARHGQAALDAALAVGAHYIDSTGEPAFIRRVFEQHRRAQAGGIALLTAFGYDYVPGNTAAAAALARAGPRAVRVDVGYFVTDGGAMAMSQGTFTSLAGALLDPGAFFNDGVQRSDYSGQRARRFELDGRLAWAVSVSGSECLALPTSHPRLRDVNVYLGWFGALSPALSVASRAQALMFRLPGYRRALAWAAGRLTSTGNGPGEEAREASGSHVIAIASDAAGKEIARADLRGLNGYTYTASMLSWGAEQVREGRLRGAGALGPVEAFGLDALIEGNREAGLVLQVR